MDSPAFISTHHLDFEIGQWPFSSEFLRFRVGTVCGLWRATAKSYDILAVDNVEKGNGHFDDLLEWFEYSCRRDGKYLRILEIWNKELQKHLITKRGFQADGLNCNKHFLPEKSIV